MGDKGADFSLHPVSGLRKGWLEKQFLPLVLFVSPIYIRLNSTQYKGLSMIPHRVNFEEICTSRFTCWNTPYDQNFVTQGGEIMLE